jgi:nucleotide-binding universal stress UspA family protein
MHVLIATDGHVDPTAASDLAARLSGQDGKVTVLTVVEIPRSLLRDLRTVYGESSVPAVDADAEYVGTAPLPPGVGPGWPGDDEIVRRYIETETETRTKSLLDALHARGLDADVVPWEHENAAKGILEGARELDADVICIGTHGLGRFEGLLGSTGTTVARRANSSVVLVRPRQAGN